MKFIEPKLIVVATVTSIRPDGQSFFVQNCEPKFIFCHCNQARSLEINNGRLALMDNMMPVPPNVGEKVALIRENYDPRDRKFTKALIWIPIAEWEEASCMANMDEMYRAIGYDHMTNGEPNLEAEDLEIMCGSLISIINQIGPEKVGRTHTTRIRNSTWSYSIRWEHRNPDGEWVECPCPLPQYMQR